MRATARGIPTPGIAGVPRNPARAACARGPQGHLLLRHSPFLDSPEHILDLTTLLVQVVSGAVGGNLGGLLNKAKSLGPLLNTILGAVGGVGGGQALGGPLTDLLGNATAGNAGASAIVGLLLPLIGGMLKKKA